MNIIGPTAQHIDRTIIRFFKHIGMPMARIALCVVFFWFGVLKVFDMSPASPLVINLLTETLPSWIAPHAFLVGLGIYEMIIGILFLIPRCERIAIFLLLPHLVATTLPLIVLREVAWSAPFVPTLEGQYIIKNVLIVATAIGIAAHVEPFHRRR